MRTALLALLLASGPASAWEGRDLDSDAKVDIERGVLVKNGETIRFYDHGAAEYRTGRITAIAFRQGVMDVEVHDEQSGRARTLVMRR